jgi:DNA-binding PadR family transcriptional regulator
MGDVVLLALVRRYPDSVALARRVRPGLLYGRLERLERARLITRRRRLYRLTQRGKQEFDLVTALQLAVERGLEAPSSSGR